MGSNGGPRRAFTAEYKMEVVELCRSGGRSIGQVCRDLGLGETAVRHEDRRFWSIIARTWTPWRSHLQLVQPETVIRWTARPAATTGHGEADGAVQGVPGSALRFAT